MNDTDCGAKMKSSSAATAITATERVRIVRPKARAASAASPRSSGEDGDERGHEPACDQHVQRELGKHEGGVVRVKLRAGAEGPGEDPVTHEAHEIAAEGQ